MEKERIRKAPEKLPIHPHGAKWRSRRDKKKQSSQTPGRQKNVGCQATPKEKFFAKRSRAYKTKDYGSWLDSTRK